MVYKKARVIYNPSSGREEAKKMLPDILHKLEQNGYEASAYATKGKGDAQREATRVSTLHFELIVAVGGDGTVYEVVNGMAEQPFRPKLAILPMGTSNDFAKALGISKNIPKALELFDAEKTMLLDVGKMDQRYFINVAGGGSLTELSYEVPAKLKTAFGQLAYYIKGAEKMTKFEPFSAEITVNGTTFHENLMLFLVANSHNVGGFDKMAPEASLQDGLLDVYLLKQCNMAELAKVISLLLRGEHRKDAHVIHFKTDHFAIKTSKNIQINLDGELGGMTPCEFEVLKQHIEFIVSE